MHQYYYNNTVPLLNTAKSQISHLIYNFNFFKFSNILSASQPVVRLGSTSAMAPDFSHKKGVYKTVILMKVHPLHPAWSFLLFFVSFFSLLLS